MNRLNDADRENHSMEYISEIKYMTAANLADKPYATRLKEYQLKDDDICAVLVLNNKDIRVFPLSYYMFSTVEEYVHNIKLSNE